MSMNGKIVFIIRKKTKNYPICLEALHALEIPNGYCCEFITIDAGKSIAADRQQAMLSCQADYKVYIEDTAIILDEKFTCKLVDTFQKDKRIGILGVIGTDIVPTNGIAISSSYLQGELYDEQGKKIAGNRIKECSQYVKTIIGIIMATQHDINWPTIYSSDFFYDTAMSLEYQHQGYKCALINISVPSVWKGKLNFSIPQKEQNLFLDNYSNRLYPLVSVIIPTYQRPVYLEKAISSVLKQTYRNLDVFVSDRSSDMTSESMIKEKFSNDCRLHYVHHPNFNRVEAHKYADAYNNPRAEYVNWLMDDDLFAPEKIARMIDIYQNNPNVSLVFSYRKCINAKGEFITDLPYTTPLSNENFIISGRKIGKAILLNQMNFIGELNTCLIKKKYLKNGHLGCFDSWDINVNNLLSDVSTWLHLCTCGDVVYLAEPLNYIRIHDGQDQLNPRTIIVSTMYWAMLLDYAIHHTNFFDNIAEQNTAIKKWLRMATNSAIRAYEYEDCDYYIEFKKVFSQVAQAFAGEKKLDLSFYYNR